MGRALEGLADVATATAVPAVIRNVVLSTVLAVTSTDAPHAARAAQATLAGHLCILAAAVMAGTAWRRGATHIAMAGTPRAIARAEISVGGDTRRLQCHCDALGCCTRLVQAQVPNKIGT